MRQRSACGPHADPQAGLPHSHRGQCTRSPSRPRRPRCRSRHAGPEIARSFRIGPLARHQARACRDRSHHGHGLWQSSVGYGLYSRRRGWFPSETVQRLRIADYFVADCSKETTARSTASDPHQFDNTLGSGASLYQGMEGSRQRLHHHEPHRIALRVAKRCRRRPWFP